MRCSQIRTASHAVAALFLLATPGFAERLAQVTIEVFPPETEIHVFLPGSPPKSGDLVTNGRAFEVKDVIEFPVRLNASGYVDKEVEVPLVGENAQAPGHWKFVYELEPKGVPSLIRHEFRKHPWAAYGSVAGLSALALGTGLLLRRRHLRATEGARFAQREAERESIVAQERFDAVDPNLVGRKIDSYEVLALLGEGAFAKVYRARHIDYGDIFALKVLRSDLLDPLVGERVEREMAIGRDLVHPNLVRAFGYGTFRNAPYLVLEFVEGRPFDETLAEGPIKVPQAIDILTKIARGLEFAHGKGVVHRDLKPANLFVLPDGGVKILDFGVAKILDSERRITLTGQALGTPHYMSPEQARGKADVASDVYALGAIAFEMLCGEPPYDGETAMEVLTSHTFAPIPSARALVPEIPDELDKLLVDMLAKEPEDRPQSMTEVIRRLEDLS